LNVAIVASRNPAYRRAAIHVGKVKPQRVTNGSPGLMSFACPSFPGNMQNRHQTGKFDMD
jgi:hypothetical protein